MLSILTLFLGVTGVTAFTWQSCGDSNDLAKISYLNVSQKESLVINIKIDGNLSANITGPIKVVSSIKKKMFWGWYDIPCMNGLGSCTIEDVCQLSPYHNSCPSLYVDQGLPCFCPITMGRYSGTIPIDLHSDGLPEWLERGTYKVRVAISTSGGQRIACVEATQQLNKSSGLGKISHSANKQKKKLKISESNFIA